MTAKKHDFKTIDLNELKKSGTQFFNKKSDTSHGIETVNVNDLTINDEIVLNNQLVIITNESEFNALFETEETEEEKIQNINNTCNDVKSAINKIIKLNFKVDFFSIKRNGEIIIFCFYRDMKDLLKFTAFQTEQATIKDCYIFNKTLVIEC